MFDRSLRPRRFPRRRSEQRHGASVSQSQSGRVCDHSLIPVHVTGIGDRDNCPLEMILDPDERSASQVDCLGESVHNDGNVAVRLEECAAICLHCFHFFDYHACFASALQQRRKTLGSGVAATPACSHLATQNQEIPTTFLALHNTLDQLLLLSRRVDGDTAHILPTLDQVQNRIVTCVRVRFSQMTVSCVSNHGTNLARMPFPSFPARELCTRTGSPSQQSPVAARLLKRPWQSRSQKSCEVSGISPCETTNSSECYMVR